MRTLAIFIALWCTQAAAYLGSFDPQPIRNEVTITFIDSQLPGPQCIAEQPAINAPIVLFAVGCAIWGKDLVIVPLTPGPGWINAAQIFATPNALLGHETRHLFDGDFHPAVLPWAERVRRPGNAAGVLVPSEQRGTGVPGGNDQERLGLRDRGDRAAAATSAAASTTDARPVAAPATTIRCTIWTKSRDVSYEDFGALVRACIEGKAQ